ncbi:hypothetical protein, partial [Propionivibrio sp.]|uniref:hypothetical protein n=1 Tax=Propionivibrio sp. TaxID=2212460 RepID=UPI003BF3B46A
LFLDLFDSNVAANAFDANVLGSAHLGSFDLVRKSVNRDGLAILQGDREESATRYLYRAWKSGDVQGRGMHFLRTYLQMMFPNLCAVDQLWHYKSMPYPSGLYSATPQYARWIHQIGEPDLKINGAWGVGKRITSTAESLTDRPINTESMYLTSRIEISLDFSVNVRSIASLTHIIRSVIPARLLPLFRFLLNFSPYVQSLLSGTLLLQKHSRMRYPWCGLVVSDSSDVRWSIGRDGKYVTLPLPFGSFKIGEQRGGMSLWKLKHCRVTSSALISSESAVPIYRLPKLAEIDRRLDGTWQVGGSALDAVSHALITSECDVVAPIDVIVTYHERMSIRYPATPARLGGKKTRLSSWRRLDGQWSVGQADALRPFGFSIQRDESILTESSALIASFSDAYATPERLVRPVATKLSPVPRRLDGRWHIGAENKVGRFRLDGRRLRAMKIVECPRIGRFVLAQDIDAPMVYERGPGRRLKLGGAWRIGGSAAPEFSLTVTKTA